MSGMFTSCKSLTSIDVSSFNTSKVTNMNIMFQGCTTLTNINGLNRWNTSNATDMGNMFALCFKLTNLDVSSFNTSNVTNMAGMFKMCFDLTSINVSGFNTSNVTNMGGMFNSCSSLTSIDVSNFNTSNVTNMNLMFDGCSKLTSIDVSVFNTSNVTSMEQIFGNCSSLTTLNLSNWDMSKVSISNTSRMFENCNFNTLVTPKVGNTGAKLPYTMYEENATSHIALPATSKTLYKEKPIITYTVDLRTNGGTINSGNITSYIQGITTTLPTNVTKTGYTFGGWYDNSSCTGTKITSISRTEAGDKTYYAKWTVDTYTVTLYERGGTINSGDITNYTYGIGAILPTDVTREGYTFGGWYTNSSFTGEAITSIGEAETGNKYYYAKWIGKTYSVTLNSNGGTINSGNITNYECGISVTLPMDITKEGYMFGGWYDNSSFTGNNITRISTTETGDKIYYAKWIGNSYRVTFYKNGGDINGDYISNYTYGTESTLPTNVTKANYTFGGWYDNDKFTGEGITKISVGESGDKVYYAKWTGNTYAVTLNTNGGIVNSGNIENYEYGVGAILPIDVTRIGYTFRGWYDNSSFTGMPVNSIGTEETENKTYYAKWTLRTTQVESGVGEEGELTRFTYEVDEDNKIVTLNQYIDEESTELTVYSKYLIGTTEYTTNIYIKDIYANNGSGFVKNASTNQLEELTFQDDITWKGYAYFSFYNCQNLKFVDLGGLNFIKLDGEDDISLDGMFQDCLNLETVNFNSITLYAKTDMQRMFQDCSSLISVEMGDLDVSNVTNMSNMFYGCKSLTSLDVSKWDTSNVMYMNKMFYGCNSLTSLDVSNWDTSNAMSMSGMFYKCNSLTDLDVSGWNTSNLKYVSGSWPDDGMFSGCNSLTSLDVSNWDTSKVTNMRSMFSGCNSLTSLDVSNWDTSKVTNMRSMFEGCNSLTSLDVSNWDTSNVTNMSYMFHMNWKEGSLTNLDVSKWNTSSVTDMSSMFLYCSALTSLDVSKWNTSSVTDMWGMFYECNSLTSLDVSKWDTSSVTNMSCMFSYCSALTSLDVSNFNTTNVTNMSSMFSGCNSLTSLNVSNFNTTSVTNMGNMFSYCSALTSLDISSFDLSKVSEGPSYYYAYMFNGCNFDILVTPKVGNTASNLPYEMHELNGTQYTTLPATSKTLYKTTYTVTFVNEGEVLKTETVTSGASATLPNPLPTKEEHTLSWDTKFNDVKSDLTVNAVWTPNTYNVILNLNGGKIEEEKEISQYTYGIETLLPNQQYVTKEGYVFVGWFENEDLTGTPVTTIESTESGEKVYYASWAVDTNIKYKVEHWKQEDNRYYIAETEERTGATGEEVIATPKPYEGYTENTTHEDRIASGNIVGDGSLVLRLFYDLNKYQVTLNTNAGTINSGDVTEYTYGLGAILPQNVTREGYVFRGWYEDEACEGTAVTTIGTTEIGEKTYYAKWLKDTDGDGIPDIEDDDTQVRYTVEHYIQNTDLTTYRLQETENTLTGHLGSTVTATAKTYTGFSVAQTNETVESGTVVDDGSLVLKLYYNRNNYTVTLNRNEGTINSGDITSYTYGIGVALPTDVTREGYVFRGWYEDEACEGTAVTTIGTTEIGEKTYYAKWLKDTDGDGIPDIEDDDTQVRYTVEHYIQNTDLTTYRLQETENTLTGHLGSTVTATAKAYTGFSVAQTNETVESGIVVDDGSLVLKLYYNRNTYKLPLNVDGEIEEIEYVYGEEITLPTDKEKEGYTFEGWHDNENLTGAPIEKVDTSKIDPENPPTYYIKWTAKEGIDYTVKHYKQQGNTTTYELADVDHLKGTTGEEVTATAKTYEGYVENTTANERIPSGIVKGDGSLELVLIYDTIKLTVIFKDGENTVDTQTIVYGENATAPVLEKEGYILRWDKEFNNITSDITVNAVWLKDTDGDGIPDIEDDDTQVRYTVEHYIQNTDLTTYRLQETENTLTGHLGSTVTATAKAYTGFSVAQTNETVESGIVVADGSLVLKLYYNRNNYAVTLNKNEGTINSGNVLQYTYGIGATLPTNVTKQGYVFRGWYEDEACEATAVTEIGETETGAKIYYAKWLKDTDGDGIPDIEDDDTQVRYTVLHYKQNVAQNGYEEPEQETKQGQLGSTVTAVEKEYTGFSVAETDETILSGTVVDDGSLVLKLYYNRENYEITYETKGGTIEDENYATTYTYGIVTNLPTNVIKEGYTFGGWYENIVEEGARAYTRSAEEKTIVTQTKETDTGAKTYYASWNVNGNTAYKVEHYKQGENGYILVDTDNLTAETESEVTAVPKTYEGYEENTTHEERKASGKVVGDGSLVLKLYYDKITYEVTFKDGETVLSTQTINYGENAVAPTPTKEGYILRWDKEFNNVKTDLTINAVWLKDTDGDGIPDIEDDETLVKYIVRHYKQQGNTNTYELAETEELQGNLGSTVTATPKVYEGYEENITAVERIPSGEITGEDTLELRLFYDTIKYEVIFKDGEKEVGRQNVPHGGTVVAPELTKEGYTLSWDKSLNNITENQTINAVWTKVESNQKTYKVEHYVQTKEGKYNLKETQELVGNIGETVTAKGKTYEEYVLDETNKDTVKTGEIKENSELVLKLYYNYKKYTIIFKDGEEEVGRVEVIHGETAEPPELTKPGYILSWDKNINNITGEQTITAVWTKDPNYKDPSEDNNEPIIDKLPDDGKEEKPSILPKTGEEVVTLGAIVGLLGVALAYFIKYRL